MDTTASMDTSRYTTTTTTTAEKRTSLTEVIEEQHDGRFSFLEIYTFIKD